MPNAKFEILPTTDQEIVDRVRAITEMLTSPALALNDASVEWGLIPGGPTMVFPVGQLDQDKLFARVLAEQPAELVRRFVLNCPVTPSGHAISVVFARADDGSCIVDVTIPDVLDAKSQQEVAFSVRKVLTPLTRSHAMAQYRPDIEQFYTRREGALAKLEGLVTRITREADRERREMIARLEEERKALALSVEKRKEELDQRYAAQVADLQDEQAALDKKKRDLDDRQHMHARRQQHQDLRASLKKSSESFTLTRDTGLKRRPIKLAFFGLISALCVSAGISTWQFVLQPASSSPLLWIFRAASVVGLAAAIVYYIRWEDSWSQTHADEEFRLMRLGLDLDRASWLVDVMLEWTSTGNELPNGLLDKLGRHLFDGATQREQVKHPMQEAVSAILASPASLKLVTPGGEASYDRKSIKDAQKKTE